MYKKSSLTALVAVLGYIYYIVGACNGCSNETEESKEQETEKCQLPVEGVTYYTKSTLQGGTHDNCDPIDPLYLKEFQWFRLTERQNDGNCIDEPDTVSDDNCIVSQTTECLTGLKATTKIVYEADTKYKGTLTINDNGIYSCTWTFTMER